MCSLAHQRIRRGPGETPESLWGQDLCSVRKDEAVTYLPDSLPQEIEFWIARLHLMFCTGRKHGLKVRQASSVRDSFVWFPTKEGCVGGAKTEESTPDQSATP